MKLIGALILFLGVNSSLARELGEDQSNIECTNSIHKGRPQTAQIKTKIKEEDLIEAEEDKGKRTISK